MNTTSNDGKLNGCSPKYTETQEHLHGKR